MKSKKSLVVITLASALLLAFPYYASALYEAPASSILGMQENAVKSVTFSVKGMSCEACTRHIDEALSKVPGVAKSSTSYAKVQTRVIYNHKKISVNILREKIDQTGYRAKGVKK